MDAPDRRRLYTSDVAAQLGVKPSTLRAYVARDQMPAPDGADRLAGLWWYPETLEGWDRPGRGHKRQRP